MADNFDLSSGNHDIKGTKGCFGEHAPPASCNASTIHGLQRDHAVEGGRHPPRGSHGDARITMQSLVSVTTFSSTPIPPPWKPTPRDARAPCRSSASILLPPIANPNWCRPATAAANSRTPPSRLLVAVCFPSRPSSSPAIQFPVPTTDAVDVPSPPTDDLQTPPPPTPSNKRPLPLTFCPI
ncbi:unnamed protein product [Musa acuminata subsp. malaccensis]|uniref:(wild Malaysian banana) hypothetical protein n=1 Tax=Musa acuminata subsp. malaccensis TaxID=214687 RepID=A0A804KUQ8_MUSAM|nr:unnamed protein product [Musa acuminata subsp. malaccensis]